MMGSPFVSTTAFGSFGRLNGTLMDKGTGEPYRDDNGNEVTATAEFTPESQGGERLADGTELADGTVELVFGPFSGANLSGRQAVAFERVADEEGRGVWAH